MIERELGLVEGLIHPFALRLFIQAKWNGVTKLAHAIHNDT